MLYAPHARTPLSPTRTKLRESESVSADDNKFGRIREEPSLFFCLFGKFCGRSVDFVQQQEQLRIRRRRIMTMIQKNSSFSKRLHRHPIMIFLSAFILIFPDWVFGRTAFPPLCYHSMRLVGMCDGRMQKKTEAPRVGFHRASVIFIQIL